MIVIGSKEPVDDKGSTRQKHRDESDSDRFQILFDTMVQGVVHQDASGKIVSMNRAAVNILGKGQKEFVGESSVSVEHDTIREDGSPFPGLEHPAMVALRTGKRVFDVPMGVYNPREKRYRWININAIPLFEAGSKEPYEVYTIFDDITDRRRRDEALRNSEMKYRSVVQAAPYGLHFYELNADGDLVITGANPSADRILGIDHSDLVGKTITEAFPGLIGTDLPEICRRVAETGQPWQSERVDYSEGKIAGAFNVFAFQTSPRNMVAAFIDITERIRAEQNAQALMRSIKEEKNKLQFILDSLPVAVGLYDANGKRILANSQVDRIWRGRIPSAESKTDFGKYVGYDTKTGIRLRAADWPVSRVLDTGEPVHNQEIDIVRRDRSAATILASAVPAKDENGATTGALIAYIDISAQKEVEKELARSNTELQSFAYAASHDLREPLRTISGFLEILLMDHGDKLDSEAKGHIKRAVDASNRLHIMIDDLLSFSRLETRKKPFRKVDLNETLSQVMSDLSKKLVEHGAIVTSDQLPTVWADDQQMAIVFRNLVDNGVKFHRREPPKIRITAKKKGDEWLICFEDNGIGIDEKFYGKIFNMFTRLHSRVEYPGTGIGLAMVRKIIERHGGRIWVESELGKGSAFFFTIEDSETVPQQGATIESWAASGAPPANGEA